MEKKKPNMLHISALVAAAVFLISLFTSGEGINVLSVFSALSHAILFGLLVIIFFSVTRANSYNAADHAECDDPAKLRADGRPAELKKELIGDKHHRKCRTTVTFDDGFRFVMHRPLRQAFYEIADHLSVDDPENREAVNAAVSEHQKMVTGAAKQ